MAFDNVAIASSLEAATTVANLVAAKQMLSGGYGFADSESAVSKSAEAELESLRREAARARLLADGAADRAIITIDGSGLVTAWSGGARRIFGHDEQDMVGASAERLFRHDDSAGGHENERHQDGGLGSGGRGNLSAALCRAKAAGCVACEGWQLRRDGTRFWASFTLTSWAGAAGEGERYLLILRDRTQARAEALKRELLMVEMNHRIKNSFAVVQAISNQVGRQAQSVAAFQTAFSARLKSLASSHDLLMASDWLDAPLSHVIAAAVAPFSGEPGRVAVRGTPVLLAADRVVSVGLVFHELATNAMKFGALSSPDGRVEVGWTLNPELGCDRGVEIVWRERGGPVVAAPARRGFGTQLLERGMPSGGSVTMEFRPEGLDCRMVLPLGTPQA